MTGIEPWTSFMQSRCPTTESWSQPFLISLRMPSNLMINSNPAFFSWESPFEFPFLNNCDWKDIPLFCHKFPNIILFVINCYFLNIIVCVQSFCTDWPLCQYGDHGRPLSIYYCMYLSSEYNNAVASTMIDWVTEFLSCFSAEDPKLACDICNL